MNASRSLFPPLPDDTDPTLITLPDSHALSIRAKALVFADPASRELLTRIGRIAPSHANVLIRGETGTGKELIARHVHQLSLCAGGPFVAVNCAALSESLAESELFGHEKGAFTGAGSARAGWFEAAHGGTLFLDEIGDLPAPLQVKLLRVLQEREVVRLGSRTPIPIEVRLIAATNVDLEEAVLAGRFREDLYYRLKVVELGLPPLRERPGDILPLVQHFIGRYLRRFELPPVQLTPEAAAALVAYPWPGNIRELENVVHHALLVCRQGRIGRADLQFSPLRPRPCSECAEPASALTAALLAHFEHGGEQLYQELDALLITTAFSFCERNQVRTAHFLGISRNVLRSKLERLGLIAGSRSCV